LWSLEEAVEDAFVAYIRANAPGDFKVLAAFTADVIEYPCVVVGCESSENPVDQAQFTGHRMLSVTVAIGIEAKPEVTDSVVVRTPREVNRALRGAVVDLLARNDLPDQLNTVAVQGVKFSMAQLEAAARTVADRVFETELTVNCIANPQEV
jgi:hypothetical protein